MEVISSQLLLCVTELKSMFNITDITVLNPTLCKNIKLLLILYFYLYSEVSISFSTAHVVGFLLLFCIQNNCNLKNSFFVKYNYI